MQPSHFTGNMQLQQAPEEGANDMGIMGDARTPRWQAIGGEDDEHWPPFLTVFKNPPRAYVAACCVGGLFAFVAIVGAAWHIKRLLGCPHSARRSLYLRMAALIVVLAVTAIFALCFVKVAGTE